MVGSRKLKLSGRPFHDITPLLREVCSIDGATVFSYSGDLLGFGCLVRLGAPERPDGPLQIEGARSTAAKRVSQRGLAVKVSADGDAILFIGGEEWGTFC
jgi:hypothetical protein